MTKKTKIESMLKKDLVNRCQVLEDFNLELVEKNRKLCLVLGQYEERLDCPECDKTVKVKLYTYGGGFGSSMTTHANCILCGTEISYFVGGSYSV